VLPLGLVLQPLKQGWVKVDAGADGLVGIVHGVPLAYYGQVIGKLSKPEHPTLPKITPVLANSYEPLQMS
jgi:hypothetical protein